MRRAKPPNVRGRGPLLSESGFTVAIVCIVKDEADYLEEWLAYHFALGVDHVFLYDNGSTDGSKELLERHQNHGLVTVIDWPMASGQLPAYNHALRFFGAAADWLAFYDIDEFLVPLVDDDIPTFLSRFPDAADVRVPRIEFGFSGHRSAPGGLTIDDYVDTANVLALDPALPPRVKSIVQPGSVSAIDAHLAFPADVLPAGAPVDTAEVEVRGLAQLNHYYTRSFSEFEAKRAGSSATGRITRPAVDFDIPTIETDTSAQRYSERTLAMIERLRSLDAKPYVYGSELRLGFFPRPNDLGRFAEFAIANTAAGLDTPSRVAAMRIKNLYDGVGIVADLSDSGFEPNLGALSGSIHTDVLLEHMRGHMDVDLASDPGEILVQQGQLPMGDGGYALVLEDGIGRLDMDLTPTEAPRCYVLGFVIGCDEPVERAVDMTVSVQRAGEGRPSPVALSLPASRVVAGVIEVEPKPQDVAMIELRIEADVDGLRLHDLFVVSFG